MSVTKILLSSASLAVLTTAVPAFAQSGGGLEDIVVTARKQAESLQQTPISVTAMTGEMMERRNIVQADQIADSTPNLVIAQQPTAMGAATVNIRGIGQTDPSMGLDTAVGIYLDGVYVARTAGAIFDLVDPERIEVLRGPQGTLFGRNTTGGAVQIISKRPAEELGLTLKGGYGTRNSWFAKGRFDTGAMGGGPLSAAFTFQHRQRDGYFDNLYTPGKYDPGSLNVNSFMAQLSGDFGAFKFDYSFDYDKRKGAGVLFQVVAMTDDALKYYGNSANLGGAPLQYSPNERLKSGYLSPAPNPRPGYSGYLDQTESWGHNLTLTLEASDAFTVKSITGYRGMEMNNAMNFSSNDVMMGVMLDPVTFGLADPPVQQAYMYGGFNGPQPQKQFSEELQFLGEVGDFSYVAGLYYFWERGGELNKQLVTVVLPGGDAALNLYPIQDYTAWSQSYAAFGQASWRPSALDGKLEVTGGIRYTKDKKEIELRHTDFGFSSVIGEPRGEESFSNVSWLGSLSYRITDDAMVYAKYSTGYKSGGFNPRADRLNSFAPEKLTSIEAGLKAEFFDRRLRTNLTGYWSRYKDLQIAQFVSGSGGAVTMLVNAGRATFKGLEAEVTIAPTEGLTITGSLGHNKPKYNEFLFLDPATDTIIDIASTARFQASPKLTTNLGFDYAFPETSIGQVRVSANWAHRSFMWLYPNDDVNPFNREVSSPATDTVSARISLSEIPLRGRAVGEIAVTGDNLLNQDQVAYGIDFSGMGFGGVVHAEPRRFGVEFKVSY